MKTTYVDRLNTNDRMMQEANDRLAVERYQANLAREAEGKRNIQKNKKTFGEQGNQSDLSVRNMST